VLLGGGRRRTTLAVAPATGLAIAAGVLTGAAYVMPMRVAAWAVLLPLTVVSAAAAVIGLRRGERRPVPADLAAPAIALLAMALALWPGLRRGTLGPFSLRTQDTFAFSHMDLWLLDHTLRATPPPEAALWDLSLLNGHAYAVESNDSVFRVGIDAASAALSALTGQDPAAAQLAFLAVLFALIPLGAWTLARGLGAGRPVAAIAAAMAAGPASLTLVADSIMANLAGIGLVAPMVLLAGRGVVAGSRRDLVHGAILLGGVLAVYPEFLPPIVAVAVAGGLAGVVLRPAPGSWRTRAAGIALRLAALAAVTVVVAPAAVYRGVRYSSAIASEDPAASIFRLTEYPIDLGNAAAWALGLRQLYDLEPLASAGAGGVVVLALVPLAVAVVAALGMRRLGPRGAAVILIPILVSALVGAAAGSRFGSEGCSYCMWKGLTFSLPFVAAAVALGLASAADGHGLIRGSLVTGAAVGLVAAVLGASLWNAASLARDVAASPEHVSASLRAAARAAEDVPAPATVLMEGASGTGIPWFTVPATYDLLRGVPDVRPAWDQAGAGERGRIYLSPSAALGFPAFLPAPGWAYLTPAYDHVLTTWGGMETGREVVRRHGRYALERRAPVDATLQRTGPPDGPADAARPSLGARFEIWVSSPAAGPGHVRLRAVDAAGTLLRLTGGGAGRRTVRLDEAGEACVPVRLSAGWARLRAARAPSGPLELAALTAGAGPCG
jgi:hypothetical protein